MANARRKISWKSIVLIIICVLLVLVLLVATAAAVILDRFLGKIDRVTGTEPTLSPEKLNALLNPTETRGESEDNGSAFHSDDITMPTEPAQIIESENTINILLIGQDRRGTSGRSLSDAMILCTFNRETKTLTMTSFLRDTYVQIPGCGNNKLNVAYPVGGMDLLDSTLELNFGVTIDGNVEVDFSQFARIVDMLGGVDIELTPDEVDNLYHDYGFVLQSGVNHLNGEEALGYARIRRLGMDFGRTNRQRVVLMKLLEKFREVPASQALDTISEILSTVTTDMTDQQILSYAMELLPVLQDVQIVSQSIPVDGSYTFGHVTDRNIYDCIFIDFEINCQVLKDTLGN